MKTFFTPLLALTLAACTSSSNKESSSQDSVVSFTDTTAAVAVTESTPIEIFEEQTSDTSQLEITFDETAGLVFERQEPYYTVSIVTKQYEAGSDVTWYFDKDFSPIYFKETWASEGNEGFTEFFIEAGRVMCASSQESSDEKKWCRKTGGLRIYDGGSGDLLSELLPSEYPKTVDDELLQYLDVLKAILNEGEKIQEDETSYTLRRENTVNYGQEFTESTEVTIPKKVYDAIIN